MQALKTMQRGAYARACVRSCVLVRASEWVRATLAGRPHARLSINRLPTDSRSVLLAIIALVSRQPRSDPARCCRPAARPQRPRVQVAWCLQCELIEMRGVIFVGVLCVWSVRTCGMGDCFAGSIGAGSNIASIHLNAYIWKIAHCTRNVHSIYLFEQHPLPSPHS